MVNYLVFPQKCRLVGQVEENVDASKTEEHEVHEQVGPVNMMGEEIIAGDFKDLVPQ